MTQNRCNICDKTDDHTHPGTLRYTEGLDASGVSIPNVYPGMDAYPGPHWDAYPSSKITEDSALNISANGFQCGYCDARYDLYEQLLEHLSDHRIEAIDTILSGHKSQQYKEKPVSEEERDDFEVVRGSQVPDARPNQVAQKILNQIDDELTEIRRIKKADERLDRLEWLTKIYHQLLLANELF